MRSNHLVKYAETGAQKYWYGELGRPEQLDMAAGVLWIVVPYTTLEFTRAALRHAGVCTDLDIHVSLVDIQVVPFPCPLNHPPVNKKFSEQRLVELFSETGLRGNIAVLYTRDWLEGFKKVLEPGSLVVVATKKRWWRTRQEKLARALTKAGHHVMLLPVVR